MEFEFSEFGEQLAQGSGIEELMRDLGAALKSGGGEVMMLGGGQPATIDEMSEVWSQRMTELIDNGELEAVLSQYDPPQGNPDFIKSLAAMLNRHYNWEISEKNIAVTSGGQSAFFYLFNMLAGKFKNGVQKKILLPLVPEYIGYANQSVSGDLFVCCKPIIEQIGNDQFKYKINFEELDVTEDIAAICVSRPTNPSGNVHTDEEIQRLADIAREHEIPLIIDNAYGAPFPNIFFADAELIWDQHIILTMSLSKVGLPGTRTGIVVANEGVTSAITSMNAIAGLANGNVGQAIVQPMLENGELLRLSREVVKPFYQEKCIRTQQWVREAFSSEVPMRMHRPEGALFLWLWFEGLPISSKELYERLKKRKVLVISGHYFFFGLNTPWQHAEECIRVTYTMDDTAVKRGIDIIAEEVTKAFKDASIL